MADDASGRLAPSVRFYRPAANLAELITSYHVVDVAHPMRDYLQPEWGNIRLVVRGLWTSRPIGGEIDSPGLATLYGPTDVSRQVDSDSGTLIGIGLSPLGWRRLIGSNASQLANRVVRLGALLGVEEQVLLDRLADGTDEARIAEFDRLFSALCRDDDVDDPIVRGIHQALIANPSSDVVSLAATAGLTERNLQRICLRAFGFAPKRLLRRQRFMRTLNNITEQADRPLGVLLDETYHDQAQFIREFQAYMGMTPSAYFKLPRVLLSAIALERRRVLGEHFQLLHAATASAAGTAQLQVPAAAA
jgi:AraC-like DNA-binding protein